MGEFPGTELDELARRIDAQAREAYQEFLRLLDAGMSPQEAIKEVMAGFNETYYAALAAAFSRVLDERWTARAMRTYPVGEVNLSRRLYAHWRQSDAIVTAIVREHAAGMQQARELALALYQGYGFRDVEPLAVLQGRFRTLPKPLRALAREPAVRSTILQTARRAAAVRLRTAALRSAYVQAFDAALEGASRPKLERLLKAAVHEKARYFANRIAQTELARAHAQAVAEEFMADPTVEVVQWQLSASHPVTDICDVFARVDRFGLGAGCYPKALAPKAPIHPFCRCRLRSRPDLRARDAREREGAERAFLREMGVRDAARAMGGRSRLQRVLNGESALSAWNRGQPKAYRVRTLGRVVPAMRVTELDALIERAAPGVTYANVTGFPFAREAVERVTGESLEGYRASISNHAIVHALKTHGSASERRRGQVPITREDLRIVPRIFRSSLVADGGLTKQGRRAVRFAHQHGDFEFTASAELRTGRRELALITMWKRPR